MRKFYSLPKINKVLFSFLLCVAVISTAVAQQPDKDTISDKKQNFKYLFKKSQKEVDSSDNQETSDTAALKDFYDMSLDDLDALKNVGITEEEQDFVTEYVQVSTKKSLSIREDPAIVSLITAEEIKNSGARDLMEVLTLVPGLHFAQDEDGIISIGIRGNWANEGKVLLMIDGIEMNEHYTAKLSFGNHYPVNLIERVEVLRGPGSIIYGGFAELAVINVITRSPDDFQGISVGANGSTYSEGKGRGNMHVYAANKWQDLGLRVSLEAGSGHRSDQDHYGFYDKYFFRDTTGVGDFASLKNNSNLDHILTNTSIYYKGLKITHISDYYSVRDISTINAALDHPIIYSTWGNYFEMKYTYNAFDKLTVEPRINLNIITPWEEGTENTESGEPGSIDQKNNIYRIRPSLMFNYDINHRLNFMGGVDVYSDIAKGGDPRSNYYLQDSTVNITHASIFGQIFYKIPSGNLIIGGRFEASTKFKPTAVPRLGFTQKLNKFHYKLLISGSYRTPTIGNYYRSYNGTLYLNADSTDITGFGHEINPERTIVMEAELGYQFSNKFMLTANFFDLTIFDPIVFTFHQDKQIKQIFGNSAGLLAYQNFDKSGTMGLELDLKVKDLWGYISLNYSYYTSQFKPLISAYTVSTFNRNPNNRDLVRDDLLLGFPKHKVNLNLCVNITKDFTFDLTASYVGAYFGYDVLLGDDIYDNEGNLILPAKYNVDGQLVEFSPNLLMNLYIKYENMFTKGLTAGLGLYRFFNHKYNYVQPYFGLRTPLAGPSREVSLKITYDIPFGKNK